MANRRKRKSSWQRNRDRLLKKIEESKQRGMTKGHLVNLAKIIAEEQETQARLWSYADLVEIPRHKDKSGSHQ